MRNVFVCNMLQILLTIMLVVCFVIVASELDAEGFLVGPRPDPDVAPKPQKENPNRRSGYDPYRAGYGAYSGR